MTFCFKNSKIFPGSAIAPPEHSNTNFITHNRLLYYTTPWKNQKRLPRAKPENILPGILGRHASETVIQLTNRQKQGLFASKTTNFPRVPLPLHLKKYSDTLKVKVFV